MVDTNSDNGQKDTKKSKSNLKELLGKLTEQLPDIKPMEPVERLVFALLGGDHYPQTVWNVMADLREYFVDWNDLRVSRNSELARFLIKLPGGDEDIEVKVPDNSQENLIPRIMSRAEAIALDLRASLQNVYDKIGVIDFAPLNEMKATDARAELLGAVSSMDKSPSTSIILYMSCLAVAPPLSNDALELAKKHKIIPENGVKTNLQKVLDQDTNITRIEAGKLLQTLEFLANPPVDEEYIPKPKKSKAPQKKKKKTKLTDL